MFRKFNISFTTDPVWQKIVSLSFVIFFIFLADAILSTWVPGLIEETVGSPLVMGLIIGFSSVVGLGTDLVFPQILRGISFKSLLLLSIFLSLVFALLLIFTTDLPLVVFFLVSMAVWGVYYEVIGFANHQFVSETVPTRMHAGAWAFLGIFRNLAYFLGPILAGFLISGGNRFPAYFAAFFALIALVGLMLSKKHHDRPLTITLEKINFAHELGHWGTLFRKVWPILVISVTLGIIDAFFWTTGAVYTQELAKTSFWGGMFLPMYTLPSLFVGLAIAKKGIVSGKKKTALRFFLLSGIFLALLNVYDNLLWKLTLVFCSSLALSITYPLIEGVYSDVIDRMGRQRRHMIGLTNSTTSIAYIVGPIIAGFITSLSGGTNAFVYLGFAVVIIALVLHLLMPKKLKLPQKEINVWKD